MAEESSIRKRRPRTAAKAFRVGAWNIGLAAVALGLVGAVGEAWLRFSKPFMFNSAQKRFVAGVGPMFVPGSETRLTDGRFFWTVSPVNAWGFVDRAPLSTPPPAPHQAGTRRPKKQAAATSGCHVAVIGDSFVVARQIPIADKLQVRLEATLAAALPHLRVTTSGFGLPSTGQVNQLPLYDNYARRLSPRVVVLVFVGNDFADNSPTLKALSTVGGAGSDPLRQPWLTAHRAADGGFVLHAPDPGYALASGAEERQGATLLGRTLGWLPDVVGKPLLHALRRSWFIKWLRVRLRQRAQIERAETLDLLDSRQDLGEWAEHQRLLEAHPITHADLMGRVFAAETLAPIYQEALALTGFGLDEFQARADRDDVRLLILASHDTKRYGPRLFERLAALAAARDIPVLDQYDHIARQGAAPLTDANWPTDHHWNAAGHRWAAATVAEYLVQHEEVCGEGTGAQEPPGN